MKSNKARVCPTAVEGATENPKQKFSAAAGFAKNWGKAALPTLAVVGTHFLLTNAVFAQGPIFTGDAGNLSNIIREGLKLMAIVLFCLGAVGIAWAIYNKMIGKEWGSQAFGGLLAFAFGTIVAVFWQIAQGRGVSVDTNF